MIDFNKAPRVNNLNDGGHISSSLGRVILPCECGLAPFWCPKPKRYTFSNECNQCLLYLTGGGRIAVGKKI